MRRSVLALALSVAILVSLLGLARGQAIQYGHTWGGSGFEATVAIEIDPAGNVYLAGVTLSPFLGEVHGAVAKLDTLGNLLWDLEIVGYEYSPIADARLTASGDLLVVGQYWGPGLLASGTYLARLSSAGEVRFITAINGISSVFGMAWDPATDGAVIIGTPSGNGTGIVAAFDSAGRFSWARASQDPGNVGFATPYGVAADGAGGVYAFSDRVDPADNWNGGVSLAKFDGSGTLVRQQLLRSEQEEYTWDLLVTTDGDLLALGAAYQDGEVLLAKFTPALDPLWTLDVGAPEVHEEPFRITEAADGSFYAVGTFFPPGVQTAGLMRFGPDGGLLDEFLYPEPAPERSLEVVDVAPLPSGGVMVAGRSLGAVSAEGTEVSEVLVTPVSGVWVADNVPWASVTLDTLDGGFAMVDPDMPVDDFGLNAGSQAWFGAVDTPASSVDVAIQYEVLDQTFVFSSAVSGGAAPYAYKWSFGDGTFSDLADPTHTYAHSGTFPVQLFVRDSLGDVGYSVVELTAYGPPSILFLEYFPRPAIAGGWTMIQAFAIDGDGGVIQNYTWDFGDGTQQVSADGNVSHVYAAPGNYTLTLTVTDDEGQSATASLLVEVIELPNSPPYACFSISPPIGTVGMSIRFDAGCSYDPDGAIVSLRWDFGDGTTAQGWVVYHAYPQAGTYAVLLEVTDNLGAVSTFVRTVFVQENVAPVAAFWYTPEFPSVGQGVYFNGRTSYDPDGYIVEWRWTFDGYGNETGNGTAYGPEVWWSFSEGGDHLVTLTVADNGNARSSTSQIVHVNAPPVAVIRTAGTAAKVGTPFAFDASASYDPDGYVAEYAWDFGDGATAEGWNVSHVYGDTGSYLVRLWVWDDRGAPGVAGTAVAVLEPKPPVAIVAWSPSRPGVGQTVTFDGTNSLDPDGSVETYIWQFGDGAVARGATADHAYEYAGAYTVKLTVIDEDDLVDDDAWTLTVASTPRADFGQSPQNALVRQPITFTAAGSFDQAGIVDYLWTFGDGTYGKGWQVSHAFGIAGTYTVSLSVTNAYGVTSAVSRDVTVVPASGPKGLVASSNLGPVAGAKVSLYAGDILIAETLTGPDGTFRFLSLDPGTYAVEITADGFAAKRFVLTWLGRDVTAATFLLEPAGGDLSPLVLPPLIAIGGAVGTLTGMVTLYRMWRKRAGPRRKPNSRT